MKEKSKENQNRWHAVEADEAVRLLASHADAGLSEREAAKRRRTLGENCLWQLHRASAPHTLLSEFLDFAAILLVITAAVAAVFDRGEESAFICVLLIFSAVMRTAASLVASRIFEENARENVPRARVIRDGVYRELPAEAVVPGDIVLLSPGDTAVCDLRLISGTLDVAETFLSGKREILRKSAEIVLPEKTVCEQRENIVFATSSVVLGEARAIAIATGERSYAFARGGYIFLQTEGKIGVLERLSGWCRTVSLVMTAAVLFLTLGGLLARAGSIAIDALFLSALALAVASMGESLSVIAAVILACAARQLSRVSPGTVIKNAAAMEHFAHAKCVIFTDERFLRSGEISVGEWFADGKRRDHAESEKSLAALIRMSAVCAGGDGNALAAAGTASSVAYQVQLARRLMRQLGKEKPIPAPLACAEVNHLHTALVSEGGGLLAYISGTLENVLACCSTVVMDGAVQPLSPELRTQLHSDAVQYESRCERTFAVAVRTSPYNNLARASALQNKMTLIGYFTVLEPVEARLSRCAEQCRAGGIRLAILTDTPQRARYLSAEAGFSAAYVDSAASAEEMAAQLADESCHAAVLCAPADRRAEIVRAVREKCGETVVVGRNIADLAVFSAATASIAVFAGAENALLDPTPQCVARRADAVAGRGAETGAPAFEALRVVGYCRSALLNLRCAAEYLLISQIMRLVLISLSVFLGLALLTPLQILLWGLALDFAAVLMMAFRAPQLRVFSYAPARLELPSFRGGMLFPCAVGTLAALLLAAVPLVCEVIGFPMEAEAVRLSLYGGGLLTSLAAACACVHERGGVRLSVAYVGVLAIFAAILLWAAGNITVSWSIAALVQLGISLLPAIVTVFLFVLYYRSKTGTDGK